MNHWKKKDKNGSNNPNRYSNQTIDNQLRFSSNSHPILPLLFFFTKKISLEAQVFFSPDLRLLTGNCYNFKLFYHSSIENIFWMQ